MIDHNALAARVRQDRETGTPGPWQSGIIEDGGPFAVGDRDCWPICKMAAAPGPHNGANARRIAALPDLEAAYLNLYDEVKRVRAERDAAISTLDAWFDRRKLGHDAVDQAVLDCAKAYLRRSRVGGMPQEESDTVLAVIEDMARLSVFADLFIRLDRERLEKAEAERDRLRVALTIYAQSGNWRLGGCCDPNSPNFTGVAIARQALKGDNDE